MRPRLGIPIQDVSDETPDSIDEQLTIWVKTNESSVPEQLLTQVKFMEKEYVGAYIITRQEYPIDSIMSALGFKVFNPSDRYKLNFIDSSDKNSHPQLTPPSLREAQIDPNLIQSSLKNLGGCIGEISLPSNYSIVINTGVIEHTQKVELTGSIFVDNSLGVIKAPTVELNSPQIYPGKIYTNKLLLNGQLAQPTAPYSEENSPDDVK